MIAIQCAICGKKQRVQELYKENFSLQNITAQTFSARRTPDRMHYRFVKCINCGLVFSNPILPPNKISSLYKKSNFDYVTEATYLKKTYGYYLEKVLPKKMKNLRLLDIGCGNGFFLEEAKEMGVSSVFGVEPGRETVKKASKWLQKRITIGLFEKGVFKAGSFDIVCCFHTLDHIVTPNTFLQDVHAILKKEGRVLFIVHDTDGLSVKLFGEKSPIFDIEHIYLFNKNTLTELFRRNKFTVLETFSVKNTYPLLYWMRMIPLPKFLKNSLLNFLQKTKLDGIPLSLNAGNIGIIAQK